MTSQQINDLPAAAQPAALLEAVARLRSTLDAGGTVSRAQFARQVAAALHAWDRYAPQLVSRELAVPLRRGPQLRWADHAPPAGADDAERWSARARFARAIDQALAEAVLSDLPALALVADELVLPVTRWENPVALEGRDYSSGSWTASGQLEVTLVLPQLA